MFKLRKITNLFMLLIFLVSLNAVAQKQPQLQQQKQVKVNVDDKELTQFAEVFKEVRKINDNAQQKMISVVQDEGLELQQFNEMYQASVDPNKEVKADSNDKAKFKSAVKKIEGMQGEFQKELETAVVDNGLSMERYEKVATALQTDRALQQRLQKILVDQQ